MGGSGGSGGAGGAGVTSLSDLCGTRTRNIHPKHILQTQSSVLVPEPNPAVGSVYKVGSTQSAVLCRRARGPVRYKS